MNLDKNQFHKHVGDTVQERKIKGNDLKICNGEVNNAIDKIKLNI